MSEPAAWRAAGHFALPGEPLSCEPWGSGHIHRTFALACATPRGPRRFVLQRLNTRIFPDPEAVMRNLVRVTGHLTREARRRGETDVARRVLQVVPARSGAFSHRDEEGGFWRAFQFVEGSASRDVVRDATEAHEAARAFGRFLVDLRALPPASLAETLPRFHDLGWRARQLRDAAARDAAGRAAACARELDESEALRERLTASLGGLDPEALPRRVVHNDCKLNNLLLDARSGEALCVIDLDTVMAGSAIFDFGELVRTATCRAPEDERDLSRLHFDLELFGALARGFLAGTGDLLDEAERAALPGAGALMALENALRFLADHLEGDVYFPARRPGHNLDRHRAQRRLAELILDGADAAHRLVGTLVA